MVYMQAQAVTCGVSSEVVCRATPHNAMRLHQSKATIPLLICKLELTWPAPTCLSGGELVEVMCLVIELSFNDEYFEEGLVAERG